MSHTILLYGATGYSGRLIAAEAARAACATTAGVPGLPHDAGGARRPRGRDGWRKSTGWKRACSASTIGRTSIRELADVDVVINAAGPFALTANHLAKGALAAGCHYVDINGEVDVYMKLDDLGRYAEQRDLAMVSAPATPRPHRTCCSTPRSRSFDSSATGRRPRSGHRARRGPDRHVAHHDTVPRQPRDAVAVAARAGPGRPVGEAVDARPGPEGAGALARAGREAGAHVRLLRPAQAGRAREPRARREPDLRIASAANLVDTLTARLTVERHGFSAIVSNPTSRPVAVARLVYQLGPLLAPLAAMPWARDLARVQLNALPAGPTPQERRAETALHRAGDRGPASSADRPLGMAHAESLRLHRAGRRSRWRRRSRRSGDGMAHASRGAAARPRPTCRGHGGYLRGCRPRTSAAATAQEIASMTRFWLATFEIDAAADDPIVGPIVAAGTADLAIEVLRDKDEWAVLFSSVDDPNSLASLTCLIGFTNVAKACNVWLDRGFPLVDATIDLDETGVLDGRRRHSSREQPVDAVRHAAARAVRHRFRPAAAVGADDCRRAQARWPSYRQQLQAPDGAQPDRLRHQRIRHVVPYRSNVRTLPADAESQIHLDLGAPPARCPASRRSASGPLAATAAWSGDIAFRQER